MDRHTDTPSPDFERKALPLVSFSSTYEFESDGAVLVSRSTLRFRERAEVERDLELAGFTVLDVRDAPDRPNKEFVFVAHVSDVNR